MKVYAAFNSTPDFHAPSPTLKSLHQTFEGARQSLYPDSDYKFRKVRVSDNYWWEGPDGFGMIKKLEVLL